MSTHTDIAIACHGLSKRYRRGQVSGYQTLRDVVGNRLKGKSSTVTDAPTFWALKDVSFTVNKGDVVGIIGRNGAGKSTLLKLLSRITRPTEGHAQIRGRVGSLLEVGTGFHPELTGRENIFLNGALIGIPRSQIKKKFDEIVDFAEIDGFIDTPVKRYSSGMYTRLAFAVAANLEPEILIIDEVLAVGDVAFQRKCMGKMDQVSRAGRTILFVSHSLAAIRKMCNRAIHLEQGQVRQQGGTDQVIDAYLDDTSDDIAPSVTLPKATGYPKAQGTRLSFLNHQEQPCARFKIGEDWYIQLDFELHTKVEHCIAAVGVLTLDGIALTTYWSKPSELLPPGQHSVRFKVDLPLRTMDLQFTVGISSYESCIYQAIQTGRVNIENIAVGEQPIRTSSSSGLLLVPQDRTITSLSSSTIAAANV